MSIVQERTYQPLAYEDDPDDYRPDSALAIVIDPSTSAGDFVDGLAVFYERIAPGDRIPLHQHTVEEVLFVDEGSVDARLGQERRTVEPGAIVFIPAGTAPGFRNIGADVARIHAVFPSREIAIRYLERNPAPGTERDDPSPPFVLDVRELLEGNPEIAVRPMPEEAFSGHAGTGV